MDAPALTYFDYGSLLLPSLSLSARKLALNLKQADQFLRGGHAMAGQDPASRLVDDLLDAREEARQLRDQALSRGGRLLLQCPLGLLRLLDQVLREARQFLIRRLHR